MIWEAYVPGVGVVVVETVVDVTVVETVVETVVDVAVVDVTVVDVPVVAATVARNKTNRHINHSIFLPMISIISCATLF